MAVYTLVADSDITALLSQYEIGGFVSLEPIQEGIENSNYILATTKGRYILTIYEKRVKKEELPFFLNLMEHFAGDKIPCPLPVHDKEGKILQEIHGKAASIVTFLNGASVKTISTAHCAELGGMLAAMHNSSKNFSGKRKNSMGLDWWQSAYKKMQPILESETNYPSKEIAGALEAVLNNWPTNLPSGVIHADLFPDNALFENNKLTGVIDFYFACNDFYAYDLAICLNAWCFENNAEFNITKARGLLAAYNNIRKISDEELNNLPVLCMGASLRFLLSRLYDFLNPVAGALVKPKDPSEYLKKLRFHLSIKNYHEYGI